jgi:hypothetical protein
MEFRYGDNDEGTLASLEQCLLSLELRYKYIGLKTVGHHVTKKKKKKLRYKYMLTILRLELGLGCVIFRRIEMVSCNVRNFA